LAGKTAAGLSRMDRASDASVGSYRSETVKGSTGVEGRCVGGTPASGPRCRVK
jgi:hypothetical protein